MTKIAGHEIALDRDIPSPPNELWYTRCPIPGVFELALADGSLERAVAEAGLTWKSLTDSTDPAVHQSHFTHRKANSFRHGGNVPAIWARAQGADTRVIAVSWPRVSYAVLALPESGITSAADLPGRRLLVPRRPEVAIDFWRASTVRVYESALSSVDKSLDDVELLEIPGVPHEFAGTDAATPLERQRWSLRDRYSFAAAILGPLVRGEVEAVTAQATLVEELVALTGAKVVFEQADEPEYTARANNGWPDVVTVSGQLAEEHPEQVATVLRTLLNTARGAKLQPGVVFDVFSTRLATPRPLLEVSYGNELPQDLDIGLPPWTTEVLGAQQDSLLRNGFIEAPFDIHGWIDPRPLELARAIE